MDEENKKPKINDRITEAYFGTPEFGDNKKYVERIHWVCSQVKGEKVLDVGCSQGIVPILLGREGINVLGIDVDEKSINYAKSFFTDEKETTLANVEFVCDNFMTRDFSDEKFDTVVCTEVLEHLTVPGRFIEKISKLVTGNGRVIFTVPFGVNNFFDHKKTYYVHDFVEEIYPYFNIEEIKFFGHWIGMICKADNKGEKKSIDQILDKPMLKRVEETFLTFENEYLERISVLRKENTRIENRTKESATKIKEFEAKLKEFEAKLKESEVKLKESEAKNKQLEQNFEILKKDLENRIENVKKEKKDVEIILANTLVKEKETLLSMNSLIDKYEQSCRQKESLNKVYEDLRNSKFGKIQLKYWNFRSKK